MWSSNLGFLVPSLRIEGGLLLLLFLLADVEGGIFLGHPAAIVDSETKQDLYIARITPCLASLFIKL